MRNDRWAMCCSLVSVLPLVVLASACAPTRNDVVGVYDLQGDSKRGNVVWELKPDGSIDASSPAGQHAVGRWEYRSSWRSPMGKLHVEIGVMSYIYKVMKAPTSSVLILVDQNKEVEFRKRETQ
jgi:hypothetical protein